jgi:hypothetical protein
MCDPFINTGQNKRFCQKSASMEAIPYEIYGYILASLQVPDTVRMGNPRFIKCWDLLRIFDILAG